MDKEGAWDGKNVTIHLDKGSVILSNKKKNLTHGQTFCIYKDGKKSSGLTVNGKLHGFWIFSRQDGT